MSVSLFLSFFSKDTSACTSRLSQFSLDVHNFWSLATIFSGPPFTLSVPITGSSFSVLMIRYEVEKVWKNVVIIVNCQEEALFLGIVIVSSRVLLPAYISCTKILFG